MEGIKLNIRLALIGVIVAVLAVVMGGRLYNIQIVNGTEWTKKSENSITRQVTIPAARGEIFDRYGRPLVTNTLSFNVSLDEWMLKRESSTPENIIRLLEIFQLAGHGYTDTFPVSYAPYEYKSDMTERQSNWLARFIKAMEWPESITAEELVTRLGEYFKLPEDMSRRDTRRVLGILYEVELRVKVPTVPVYTFAEDIDIELVGRIKEASLPGVQVDSAAIREYQTGFAAHILGRVGKIPEERLDEFKELGYASDEIVGIDGAERAFEQWLHGTSGTSSVEMNSSGKVQNVLTKTEAKPGSNVYLTIDIRLQEEVEQLLENIILRLQAEAKTLRGKEAQAGAIVITDVNTGEILTMASYPTFSLQTFSSDYSSLLEDPLTPLLNRAIAGIYSPGSTYKMVTAAAALEEGIITEKTLITDKGVYTYYKAPQPKCNAYPGTHGTINVLAALQKSCNYFFYDVGRLSGIEAQGYWAGRFGLGGLTGIELAGEKEGYIAGPETSKLLGLQWYPGNALSAAIGQSDNTFTPIQLAAYVAAIANGGTLYGSHILKEVKSNGFDQTVFERRPEELHELGISEGTISILQRGMRMVAQPGGTASATFGSYPVAIAAKTGSVQSSNSPNNGVFVAYGPYDAPEISVAVVIEKGGAGSVIAPVARDVFDVYFRLRDEMNEASKENQLQR